MLFLFDFVDFFFPVKHLVKISDIIRNESRVLILKTSLVGQFTLGSVTKTKQKKMRLKALI